MDGQSSTVAATGTRTAVGTAASAAMMMNRLRMPG